MARSHHIIKSSDEISTILKEGIRVKTALVTLFVRKTPQLRDQDGRVAFIAAKRLGNAVWRNRSKRVMRAALHEAGGAIPGYDLLVMAKQSTQRAGSSAVAQELVGQRRKLLIK